MPDRWQKIKELFQAAVEHDPGERAAFLARACIADSELHAEVESLLAAHERAGDFIEATPAAAFGAPLPAENLPTAMRQRVGAYELLAVIASGGMGDVYRAVRADDAYRREVAVKLIRTDRVLDDPLRREEQLRRFRHERQTLADLDHPNIARLYDGGSTDDGVPYLVMEYVEGQPIDAYCDARRLSTTRRLELFRDVCAAVQYAHQHLVIHRDLKPGNILVTNDGVSKLLDFGIAKLLADEATGPDLPMTRTGMRLMTPEYASPEQIRGQPVSTAADVYALGVILYELLTGHRPYRRVPAPKRDEEPPVISEAPSFEFDLARLICEQEPEPPSSAVTRIEDVPAPHGTSHITLTPQIVSQTRDGHPDRLRRRLTGDLDNIVLMALRKDPQRRYASVEQFSEDLRRHLAGLPVVARKDTLRYRTTKFVRRHRAAVVAATTAMIALLGGIIAILRQAEIADTQRHLAEANLSRAAAAEKQAVAEAQTANEVAKFMVDVFKVADPFQDSPGAEDSSGGSTLTAERILERGAERITRELSDRPVIQARLLDTIGRVYQNLGLYPRADRLLKDALDVRQRILGENDADVATSLNNLGEVRRAAGDYASAESLLCQALDLRRRLLGEEHALVAATLENLARLEESRGHYADAEQLYREALDIYRKHGGDASPDVARELSNLAVTCSALGDYEKAEQLQREALGLLRQVRGDRHLDVAAAMGSLADVLQMRREYAEAESLYRQTLDIYREALGDEHPYLAIGLNNLASVLEAKGDLVAAEPLHRQALALVRKLYGPDHPAVASSLNNLAMLLKAKGDLDGAESLFHEALDLRRRVLGNDHPLTALSLNNLGLLLCAKKDYGGAEPLFREALAIRRERLGNTHPLTLKCLNNLAVALRAKGDLTEAQALRREWESAQEPTTQPGS